MVTKKDPEPKKKPAKKATPKKVTPKKTAPKKAAPKKAAPKKTTPKKVEVKTPALETTSTEFTSKIMALGTKNLLIGGATLVLALVAITIISLSSGGGGNGVILASLDSDYMTDFYTADYKKTNQDPVRILKNVEAYVDDAYFSLYEADKWIGAIYGAQFVSQLDKIFFLYQDGDDMLIEQMDIGSEEPEELFQSEDPFSSVLFVDEGRLIVEERDNDDKCYFSDLDEEADRVVKADFCASLSYNLFYVEDSDDLSIYNIKKDEETELIKDLDEVYDYTFSDDFSTVAYVVEDGDEAQLFAVGSDGEEVELSEEIDMIFNFQFQPGSTEAGLFIGADKDDLGIYLFSIGDPIIEEKLLDFAFSEDGKFAVIIAGEDYDDLSVYSYNMKKDELEELYSGDEVGVAYFLEQDFVLIVEQDEDDTSIYASDFGGSEPVKIYDNDLQIEDVIMLPGIEKLFIEISEDDTYSLLVNEIDEEANFALIDEWYYFELLNYSPSGKYLVFQGQEDDDDAQSLFIVEIKEDAEIVELHELDEDYYWYQNAVFTSNEKYVLFSAPIGDDVDEVSVFEVKINGEEDAEEIYEEMFLQDVEWGNLDLFRLEFYTMTARDY